MQPSLPKTAQTRDNTIIFVDIFYGWYHMRFSGQMSTVSDNEMISLVSLKEDAKRILEDDSPENF